MPRVRDAVYDRHDARCSRRLILAGFWGALLGPCPMSLAAMICIGTDSRRPLAAIVLPARR